jgi:hypothetical protein
MLSKKEKQKNDKTNMELYDDSLGMNVFDKVMEGKHNNDDSMRIEKTNNLFISDRLICLINLILKIIRTIIMMELLTHLVKELN